MTISNYCKNQKMTLEQYKQFQQNIKNTASAIIQLIEQNYIIDNGVYHDTTELFPYNPNTNEQVELFIIQELKQQGVEFYNNNTEWRL